VVVPTTQGSDSEEAAMSEHPNVARLRDGYAAFAKGDFAALDDLFGENVRWHEPGHHQLSGTHEGRTAVYNHFRRVFELTDGTFRAEPQVFFADDNHGMALLRVSGSRGDRPFEVLSTQVLRFADGRAVEVWIAHTDPDVMDEAFA